MQAVRGVHGHLCVWPCGARLPAVTTAVSLHRRGRALQPQLAAVQQLQQTSPAASQLRCQTSQQAECAGSPVSRTVRHQAVRAAAHCCALPALHGCSSGQLKPLLQRPGSKCYSTPGPSSHAGSLQHISWLHDVQAWCPPHQATPGDQAEHNSNNNHNSSSNHGGNGGVSAEAHSGNGSGSSAGQYQPPRFKPVSEAQLQDSSSGFDAIVVLAGGLAPDGSLPEWVCRRMDVARDLHLLQGRAPAIICSGGGTPHKPAVIAPNGHIIHESTSGASYLMATGVQPGAIFKEVSSFDTVGNAYFSLVIHALPAGWRRLAVVTSDFHMPRSCALFADIFRLAGQSLFNDPSWYSLTFLSASDDDVFDSHVYNARLGKEAGSLAHWQQVAAGLADLAAFHSWFFSEHLCYAVPRQHEFGKRTIEDQRLLDSY